MDWDKGFKKTVVYSFHALLFLVPLTWTGATSELFEFPKMLLVYGLTVVVVGAWLGRMLLQKRLMIRRTPFDIPLLLFFISQLVSTLISIDTHTSIYGYYSRFHGGLLSTVSYLLLFYAFVSNVDLGSVKKLLKTLLAAALVASLYAIPEHFGLSPSCIALGVGATADCWVQDVVTRVFGTFGQPNWLAAYLITVGFIPLALIIKTNKAWWINWSSYVIFFMTLIFTKSRSGILGLAIGFLLFAGLNLVRSQEKIRVVKLLVIGLLVMASVFVVFGKGIIPQYDRFMEKLSADNNSQINTPVLETRQVGTQLETGGTESGEIRKIVWDGAIRIWQNSPLFGSGVETFAYAYNQFRPVEHNLVSEWDFLYNKAHNEFLNFAATTGSFGLLSYLSIITVYLIWSIKLVVNKSKNSHLLTALASGFVALMVSNFFGFSTVSVAFLFFLFPAFSLVLSGETRAFDVLVKQLGPGSKIGLATLALVSLLCLMAVYGMLSADKTYAQGKRLADAQKLTDAIPLLNQAIKKRQSEPLYKDDLSRVAAKAALGLNEQNEATTAAQLAELAITLNKQAIEQNEVQLNFYKTRANILGNLAVIDPSYLGLAEETLDQALKLAPTDAKVWLTLGLVYIQQGRLSEAEAVLSKTIELKPNYEQARYSLGLVYEELGEKDKAADQYKYILEKIQPENNVVKKALENL
jgi:O-antigen ligase/Flp pilus assembly protein TadD